MIRAADKTFLIALAAAVLLIAAAGCASSANSGMRGSARDAAAPRAPDAAPRAAAAAAAAFAPESAWAVLLLTFTQGDHALAAQRAMAQFSTIAPQLRGARVHTTTKGSMVVYGSFASPDDPAAKSALDQVKQITHRGRSVFPRAILTQIDLRPPNAPRHPHDLRSARQRFPKVEPLYTLDVAIWVAADAPDQRSGALTYDECRRRAQAYAQQLRAQGLEAFFYHDDALQQSTATVGLFDRRAIDAKSGFYSSEVLELIRRHPVRLFNGEPLQVYKDPKLKTLGTQPQEPKLALVPPL